MCLCKDKTGEDMEGSARPGTPAPAPVPAEDVPSTARSINQPSAGRTDSSGKYLQRGH